MNKKIVCSLLVLICIFNIIYIPAFAEDPIEDYRRQDTGYNKPTAAFAITVKGPDGVIKGIVNSSSSDAIVDDNDPSVPEIKATVGDKLTFLNNSDCNEPGCYLDLFDFQYYSSQQSAKELITPAQFNNYEITLTKPCTWMFYLCVKDNAPPKSEFNNRENWSSNGNHVTIGRGKNAPNGIYWYFTKIRVVVEPQQPKEGKVISMFVGRKLDGTETEISSRVEEKITIPITGSINKTVSNKTISGYDYAGNDIAWTSPDNFGDYSTSNSRTVYLDKDNSIAYVRFIYTQKPVGEPSIGISASPAKVQPGESYQIIDMCRPSISGTKIVEWVVKEEFFPRGGGASQVIQAQHTITNPSSFFKSYSKSSEGIYRYTVLSVKDDVGLTKTGEKSVSVTVEKERLGPEVYIAGSKYVEVGEYVTYNGIATAKEPGATIDKYKWNSSPNSFVRGGSSKDVSGMFTSMGTYVLYLDVTDSNGLTASAMYDVYVTEPYPNAHIDFSGTLKEYRKLTIDGTGSTGNSMFPINWSKAYWLIKPVNGSSIENIVFDVPKEKMEYQNGAVKVNGLSKFDAMVTVKGEYEVTLYVENTIENSDTDVKILSIKKDLPPIVDFTIPETLLRKPDEGNKATVNINDTITSLDDDIIQSKTIRIYYNSNNGKIAGYDNYTGGNTFNASWTQIHSNTFNTPIGSTYSYNVNDVGTYKVEIEAVESYGQPSLDYGVYSSVKNGVISDYSHYQAPGQKGYTTDKDINEKVFEVKNIAPTAELSAQKINRTKTIDVAINVTGSGLTKAQMQTKVNSILIPAYQAEGLDYSVTLYEGSSDQVLNNISWRANTNKFYVDFNNTLYSLDDANYTNVRIKLLNDNIKFIGVNTISQKEKIEQLIKDNYSRGKFIELTSVDNALNKVKSYTISRKPVDVFINIGETKHDDIQLVNKKVNEVLKPVLESYNIEPYIHVVDGVRIPENRFYYIGTDDYLYQYDPLTKNNIIISHNTVKCAFVADDGYVYYNDGMGIYRCDPDSHKLEPVIKGFPRVLTKDALGNPEYITPNYRSDFVVDDGKIHLTRTYKNSYGTTYVDYVTYDMATGEVEIKDSTNSSVYDFDSYFVNNLGYVNYIARRNGGVAPQLKGPGLKETLYLWFGNNRMYLSEKTKNMYFFNVNILGSSGIYQNNRQIRSHESNGSGVFGYNGKVYFAGNADYYGNYPAGFFEYDEQADSISNIKLGTGYVLNIMTPDKKIWYSYNSKIYTFDVLSRVHTEMGNLPYKSYVLYHPDVPTRRIEKLSIEETIDTHNWRREGSQYYIYLDDGEKEVFKTLINTNNTVVNPVKINLHDVKKIATMYNFVAVLKHDGTVWVWGDNSYGLYGDGTKEDNNFPYKVNIDNVKDIAVGYYHVVALKNDGTVWTWGYDTDGNLGRLSSKANDYLVPGKVDIDDVKSVYAGGYHTLVIKNDGTVWAWGQNKYGQLGNGNKKNTYNPVEINITDVKELSLGTDYTIAVKNDGTLWAWGRNNYGQLGDGTKTDRTLPKQININDVKTAFAGSRNTKVLKNDGTVWTWGDSLYGELGYSGTSTVPKQVSITDVSRLYVHENYAFAVKNDGTVWAWGSNSGGQLGDGSKTSKSTPTKINITDVKDMVLGGTHTLLLKNDGTLWATGSNAYGQFLDGTTNNSTTFKKVNNSVVQTSAVQDMSLAVEKSIVYSSAELKSSTGREMLKSKLSDGNINFIGLGTEYNKTYIELFQDIGFSTYIDNTDLDNSLMNLALHIISTAGLSKAGEDLYVLVNQEIEYSTGYDDAEKDPFYADRWFFAHIYDYFENNLGLHSLSGVYLSTIPTYFDKTGKYIISYQTRDNPKNSSYFDSYRLWSNPDIATLNLYVHRKPIADFSYTATKNTSTGVWNITLISNSYDLDHVSLSNKGIVQEEWMYKEENEATWTKGKPAQLHIGKIYLVQLTVKDMEGAWSDPCIKIINTGKIDLIPSVDASPTSKTVKADNPSVTVTITADDKGENDFNYVRYKWDTSVTKPTSGWSTSYSKSFNNTKSGAGTFYLHMEVFDQAGNNFYRFRGPYILMYDTAPTVDADPPTKESVAVPITVTIIADDKGENDFSYVRYKWDTSTTKPSSGWSTNYNKQFNTTLSSYGTYYLHMEVFDNTGNSFYRYRGPYILKRDYPPTVDASPTSMISIETPITVIVTASDNGEGDFKEVRYKWTDSTTKPTSQWNVSTIKEFTTGINQYGIYYLHMEAFDQAGNSFYRYRGPYELKQDLPPTIQIDPETKVFRSKTGLLNVLVDISDNGENDFKEMKYKWDTSTTIPLSGWTTSTNQRSTLSAYVNDTYYLHVQAFDLRGNSSYKMGGPYIRLPDNDPTVDATPTSKTIRSNTEAIEVLVEADDRGDNDFDYVRYAWSASTAKPASGWTRMNTNVFYVYMNTFGTYYLHMEVFDKQGNSFYRYRGPYVKLYDNTPTVDANPTSANSSGPITVTVTADDKGDNDFKEVRYKWTTTTSKPTSGWSVSTSKVFNTVISTDGTYYLHMEVFDQAGNSFYRYRGPYTIESLGITGVTIEGYWNHWRGQVNLFGKRMSVEPHRFLSLERVKINVYTTGYAEKVEIRFSPELEAMQFRDKYGNLYDYKNDFGLNYVYFPKVITLDSSKKDNHVYWEYILPLANSTKSWEDERLRQPYMMEVTIWRGTNSVKYTISDIDITGNIFDLTYIQPVN